MGNALVSCRQEAPHYRVKLSGLVFSPRRLVDISLGSWHMLLGRHVNVNEWSIELLLSESRVEHAHRWVEREQQGVRVAWNSDLVDTRYRLNNRPGGDLNAHKPKSREKPTKGRRSQAFLEHKWAVLALTSVESSAPFETNGSNGIRKCRNGESNQRSSTMNWHFMPTLPTRWLVDVFYMAVTAAPRGVGHSPQCRSSTTTSQWSMYRTEVSMGTAQRCKLPVKLYTLDRVVQWKGFIYSTFRCLQAGRACFR